MQGMILAAGYGLRMKPITNFIPKPLLPLFGIPIIEYRLSLLKQLNITDILINLHHLPHAIIDHIGNGEKWGIKVKYLFEKCLLGTGGAVKNAGTYISSFPLCLVNSDTFCNIDIQDMYNQHKAKRSIASLALSQLTSLPEEKRIWLNLKGEIIKFSQFFEKENIEKIPCIKCDFAGIHLLEEEIIDFITRKAENIFDINRDIYPQIMGAKTKKISAYIFNTYWSDMGTPERYFTTHIQLLTRNYPKTLGFKEISNQIFIGENVRIKKGAKVFPPVAIASNSTIFSDTIIGPRTIVGKECVIKEKSTVQSSIILNCTTIPKLKDIKNAIVLENPKTHKIIYMKVFSKN